MASITTEGRNELIALYTAMFNAAPGATNLNEMVAAVESGKKLIDVANGLAAKADFSTVYPALLTADEFAARLVGNMLGSEVSAAASTWATNWVKAQLSAGQSPAFVISTAVQSIRSTTNTDFANAKAMLANKVDVASYYSVTKLLSSTDLVALQAVISGVTSTATTVTTAKTTVDGTASAASGKSFSLSTTVDTITGTIGNDSINAILDATGKTSTLTALDTIDGAAGTDKLTVNDLDAAGSAFPASAIISGVEEVVYNSSGTTNLNTTTLAITGMTSLKVNGAGTTTVTTGKDVGLTITNLVNGVVTANGGSSQTVTAKGGVVLGGTTATTGAIVVTDSAQNKANSKIDGGSTVTVTTNYDSTNAGENGVAIGATTAPTGAVSLTVKPTGVTTGNSTAGDISVKGGTTVTVTSTATQPLTTVDNGTNYTLTQSKTDITGTSATTTVVVNQTPAQPITNAPAATKLAVAATVETASVVFSALAAGKTIILDGVTLTAPTGGLTAKQVAAAFANVSFGALGTYSSGAVSGSNSDTVVFTAKVAGNATDLADTGDGAATAVSITQGVAAVTAAGNANYAGGAVSITDSQNGTGKGSITSVTLSNYGNSTITDDAMTSLSLTGRGGTLGITNTAGATTLALTANGLTGTNTITEGNGTYTTLNVTTTGASSTVANLAFKGATALTLAGDKSLTLTSAAGLSALKTITVSGAAGLTANAGLAATLTDLNASATSGAVSATIDATAVTYTGGSGVDTVTIAAVPTKAINGGAGTADILSLNVAAAAFSNPSTNTNLSGFEILGAGASATGSYDATGFTGLRVGAVTGDITFTNVAAGAGLNVTASPTKNTTYTLKDATGTADSLAITVSNAVTTGTLTANGVETVSISSGNNILGTAFNGASTVTLSADAVTKLTVAGSGGTGSMTLNVTATTLTEVDASGYLGTKFTYTAAGTVAETVKGSAAGVNILGASTGTTLADKLTGGSGNDVLTGNKGLAVLTGNGGNDTFVVVTSANLNSYTTITDANAGDTIRLVNKGVETFQAAKISLGDTAVFQDYANAAINAGGDASTNGYVAWFQFSGNTYIVQSMHNATTPDFQNGTDAIVKLTGLLDLSTAAFFSDAGGAPQVVLR